MDTKICTKCGRELSLSKFHRDNRKGRGYYSQCRDCKAECKRQAKDKLLQSQYKRRERKKEELSPKRKAYNKVYYALKAGKLIKPAQCEICKSTENIQAHHKDYSKPLEVDWVCQKCHVELDNQRREQE